MNDNDPTGFEDLKNILKNARSPERLNDHPWTQSLIVQAALTADPGLSETEPGQQLVSALAGLFRQMQPAAPPRRGKRLDPRWGEFGLLAALYFAPFNHGTAFPATLLDAWRRIDPAILYFVYGKPAEALEEGQVRQYELVGAEAEYGSASTLSDWHRKGLQRLAEIILNQERLLARTSHSPSAILGSNGYAAADPSTSRPESVQKRLAAHRGFIWLSLALLLAALGLAAFQAREIYASGSLVYQDLRHLQSLRRQPLQAETLEQALPMLEALRADLSRLKGQVPVLLWMSPGLGWVPAYGQDLASLPRLFDLAEHSLDAAILAGEAARPLAAEVQSPDSTLTPARAADLLVQAQPGLEEARLELDQALAARKALKTEELSPPLRDLIRQDLDPLLEGADEGLSLARVLPGLLGAGSNGPKTYLLLAQNEDELRPTGGFITSIGNLVVRNGEVLRLEFESVDTDVQENWSQPYPAAPWQLEAYMDAPVLILRDANWFTDFPTTVEWVEYLYAYKHSHSVDGVIAFDQHFLVMLLEEIGPLQLEEVDYPITAQNVIEYMRQSKVPPPGRGENWYRKEFVAKLGEAVLSGVTSAEHRDWQRLGSLFIRALAERHLLLQLDDPTAAGLLARRDWDNAVRPGEGDYLMVVDSNVGFNKTNAIIEESLAYDVDLSDLAAPRGTLTVRHTNPASKDVPCQPRFNSAQFEAEQWYPINRCYWNYLRVYKQAGVTLLDASPQAILAGWTIQTESVPARVDVLDEEIPGVQGFGTLQVVHGGQTLSAGFEFSLPDSAVAPGEEPGVRSYRLRVQKQPGTRGIPILIRIHLPNGASLSSVPAGALVQDNHLLIETDLQRDVEVEILFRPQ